MDKQDTIIRSRYFWYDLIRGIAALMVCASHLRAMMFVDIGELKNPSIGIKLFYLVTGLGHQAVMVFFVLSGFFVGGSVLRNAKSFKLGGYMEARLVRLWVVLVPALMFTFILDHVTLRLSPETILGDYSAVWNSGPSSSESWTVGISTLLGNLFYLQKIYVPVFGSNGPLWSLAYEFWYYIMFPLALISIGFAGKMKYGFRICSSILLIVLFILLPGKLHFGFLIWLIGALISVIKVPPKWIGNLAAILGSAALSLAIIGTKSNSFSAWQSDLLIGVCFGVMAYGLRGDGGICGQLLRKPAYFTSEFSFSLYLLHFPPIMLIGGLFYKSHQLQPGPYGFAVFSAWFALLIIIGLGGWLLFERHTPSIKKRLRKIYA